MTTWIRSLLGDRLLGDRLLGDRVFGNRANDWQAETGWMRPGSNKRMRGRNRRGPNPLARSYESNGPDVKVRGTAQHIADRYLQLARDAQSSGDPVTAENYFQHAEHYLRIIAAAQEQMQAQYGYRPPSENANDEDGEGDEGEAEGF